MRKALRSLLTCLTLLAIAAPGAFAQGKSALVGGRLIDGFGHAPIQDSVILVENDTIVAVGTVDTLPVPDSYEVFSTEGMDVLPGLWESHAHLMLTGHSDYVHWQETYADRYASEIMPATAVHLLLAGVTSTRDLGAPLEGPRVHEPSVSTHARHVHRVVRHRPGQSLVRGKVGHGPVVLGEIA